MALLVNGLERGNSIAGSDPATGKWPASGKLVFSVPASGKKTDAQIDV